MRHGRSKNSPVNYVEFSGKCPVAYYSLAIFYSPRREAPFKYSRVTLHLPPAT